MDFSLDYTPEQEQFRREVATWLDENVPKDLAMPWDSSDLTREEWLRRREFGRKLGEKGWLAPGYPKEYGGGGLSWELAFVIEQELENRRLYPPFYDLGLPLGAPAIVAWGTEEQKRRFLPPMCKGEVVTWQLFTEPEAGSDLANVRTKAVRDGDDFVINGHKIFVGGAHGVECFWLLACTDLNGARHKNLSMFVVPTSLEGITITPLELLSVGEAPSGCKNAITLDNVRVPAADLIGGLNNGWAVANSTLEVEHGGHGNVGMSGTAVQFFQYCRETPRVKNRVAADPVVADVFAQAYIEAEVERLIGMRNYWMRAVHHKQSYQGAQFALYKKEAGIRLASYIQKVVGPYALTKDPELAPVNAAFEVHQRSSIVTAPGGTIDVQKVVMARRLGIGRAVKEEAAKL